MTVGEKVKMLREALNMTQEELAKAVGYKTRSSITKIETGESDPTQKKLMRLADVLGVSPAELLGDSDDRPAAPAKTMEARILARGVDKLPEAERERALNAMRVIFSDYADYFEKGMDDDHDDDTP